MVTMLWPHLTRQHAVIEYTQCIPSSVKRAVISSRTHYFHSNPCIQWKYKRHKHLFLLQMKYRCSYVNYLMLYHRYNRSTHISFTKICKLHTSVSENRIKTHNTQNFTFIGTFVRKSQFVDFFVNVYLSTKNVSW